MHRIIYKAFRYAGAGLDEISRFYFFLGFISIQIIKTGNFLAGGS